MGVHKRRELWRDSGPEWTDEEGVPPTERGKGIPERRKSKRYHCAPGEDDRAKADRGEVTAQQAILGTSRCPSGNIQGLCSSTGGALGVGVGRASAPLFGGSCGFNGRPAVLSPEAMRPALLLLLLLRPSWADPPQERVPLFRVTQQGPWGSSGSNATDSPCEGLPAAEATALSLANRSLERLPGCLPRTLRRLDASHNLLRALSASELGHLEQLQVLALHHNRIASLRWGPGGPAGLHTLDLSCNQLAALPPCAGPALSSLRALGLAQNPLQALQPRTFACFPALQLLNLSFTALGRGPQGGIAEAAFAGEDGAPLATLEVLDLSGTFLERVESAWLRDLPKLTSLHLRKMPRLTTLEGDIFKMTPNLRQLDCQDSPALASVATHIFQDTPHLQVLLFQK
ncbi:Leucine-rich repeat neuronal protein 4 [Saguinus oedipus]|uniref:Leucine-rich repeat neuronal protein 4 n=1 Tax=Saguinus oedipus TaxID=9490 RepID=A0ABQ9VJS3_SAGOE|nr:Leucine-rich repeat neuronal protein 4 [Saguinus oedipus]